MNTDILIIGGGASGLMLAALLPKNSATIIESNAKLGAKIHISGGGKCNITNAKMGTEYFLARHDFIMPALKRFSQKSLLIWLERQRLFPVIRKN
ncbi:MAG: NAD(P)/FAD-dependent oxidoreductase, partial [Sulfurovum sp.]|nr:NAD(P)/FAD-dependent oxidoreductase [Sulfurovum sp.]